MRLRLTLILGLVLLFVVLIAQNSGETPITFLFWTATLSRIGFFAITFLIGLVVGFLLGRPWRRKKREYARVKKAGEEREE